jgi:hypothetical protein
VAELDSEIAQPAGLVETGRGELRLAAEGLPTPEARRALGSNEEDVSARSGTRRCWPIWPCRSCGGAIPGLTKALIGRFDDHHGLLVQAMLTRLNHVEAALATVNAQITVEMAPWEHQLPGSAPS